MARSTAYEGTITYNGQTLPFSRLEVTQRTLYADDNSTLIGVAHDFTVTGFLAANDRQAFQAAMTTVRRAWQAPRGNLVVQSGGKRIWSFTPHPGGADPDPSSGAYAALVEDWGPLPGEVRFHRFAAGMACAYTWTVSCVAKECLGGGTCGEILSLTQAWSHVVDLNGLTTRTVTGRLVVRNGASQADAYRAFCTPDLPQYYQRASASFRQSEDGRELTFSVVDAEQSWTLPKPLTGGNASLQVSIVPPALVTYTLSGTFEAPPSVPKATILQRINDLMVVKIPNTNLAPGAATAGVPYFQRFDFTDEIYANRITFSIVATVAMAANASPDTFGGNASVANMAAALQTLVLPPPNSDGYAALPNPYGGIDAYTSGVMAPAHVDFDACTSTPTTPSTPIPEGGANSTGGGSRPDATSVATSSIGHISDEHQQAPWLAYHEQISYEFDNGLTVFVPKQKGVKPIVHQSRAPRLHIIQAGYCTRVAGAGSQRPNAPERILKDHTVPIHVYVSPAAEEVIDALWSKWTVHWRYVLHYTEALSSSLDLSGDGTDQLYWPKNPIRPAVDQTNSAMAVSDSVERVYFASSDSDSTEST